GADEGKTGVGRGGAGDGGLGGVDGVVVTASNRAGMVYRLPSCKQDVSELAERAERHDAVDVALFRDDGTAVARRDGEELRFRPAAGGWETTGDASLLDHPNALERAWAALANPRCGDVIVSAGR